ncbi:MAG: carboxypeptidase regulatory-like domain-containing protein, partial [Acidobacteriota bacterium]
MTRELWGVALAILLSLPASAVAQVGVEGSILGFVKDETEAVVPGAEVRVANLETGLTETVLTNDTGYFEVLALPRGAYTVSVELPGFKTWRLERTSLTAGEAKRIFPVLEVGEVTQQVTVQSAMELMQTEKASVESSITEREIRDLPVKNRNAVELVALVPGMRVTALRDTGQLLSRVQGLGKRDDQAEFQIDGLSVNESSNEGGITLPNIDTIAEFRVQTANFTAEEGRQPLQVQAVTKSGTNEFHGTFWEFHRNDALDAKSAFARTKSKNLRNQFGFSLGGPIAADQTFFFTSYEGIRLRRDRIYNAATISAGFAQGDFSQLGKTIKDPLTGEALPNNQIPEER